MEVSCSSSELILSISERSFGLIRLITDLDILLFYYFGMCDCLKLIPPPIELLLGMKFLLTNLVLRSLHCLIRTFSLVPELPVPLPSLLLFSAKFFSSDLVCDIEFLLSKSTVGA